MPKGIQKLQIIVGEKNLTHFGGIFLIHWFCKKLKLKWILQRGIQFNQRIGLYHPVELILAIIFTIIAGINRLSKTKILQGNGAFQKIVGLKKFPYASSLRRFLKRTNPLIISAINKIHDKLRLKMFHLPHPRTSILLDFDSTAVTIYGKQIEGAEVGYNPGKKGKRSYHPLVYFEYHTKDFWHGILRPGNVYTSFGAPQFLQECLQKIPPYIYRIRVRTDSGFFDHKFIKPLDEKRIGYVIVAKLTKTIKGKLHDLHYRKFKKGWSVAEFQYTPYGWKKPHRFVVIRRKLPNKPQEQPTLFTLERYSYQVFVTNLFLKPENIWYFYRARASIEVHIKELKQDFFLTKIPTNKFLANQMYFSLLLFAYNIVNWFKRLCLPQKLKNATLETIRTDIFVLPAKLVNKEHQNILKLPEEYISTQLLDYIMNKIEKLKII
ncbi:MAG: hypothetical protein AUJ85_09010 [Elusimicrobia bacterium CG1_02_37_114]|nr:MAG: hypothetical protein AUJ85_09010 [Elusimicrobia bacterium CG1_02_37_114]